MDLFRHSLGFVKKQLARFSSRSSILPDLVASELSELIETVRDAHDLNSLLSTLNMRLMSIFHLFTIDLFKLFDATEIAEITRIKGTYYYFRGHDATFPQVMMFLWGYEQPYDTARNLFDAEETITMDHANDFKTLQEFGQHLLKKMLSNKDFITHCRDIPITNPDGSRNHYKCAFKAAWILNDGDLSSIMDALLVREYDPRAMTRQHMTKLKVKNVLSVFFSERTAAHAVACPALEILPLSRFAHYPQEIADVIYVPNHTSTMSLDDIEGMIPDLTGLKGAFHEECKVCLNPFKKFKWRNLHSATCSTPRCAMANPVCGKCIDTWRIKSHPNPTCPFCKQNTLSPDTIATRIDAINEQLETLKQILMTFDFMQKCDSIQSHPYYPRYVKYGCATLMKEHQALQLNKANETRVKRMLDHVVTRLKRLDPSDPADYEDRLTATSKRKREHGGARKTVRIKQSKQSKQSKAKKQRVSKKS